MWQSMNFRRRTNPQSQVYSYRTASSFIYRCYMVCGTAALHRQASTAVQQLVLEDIIRPCRRDVGRVFLAGVRPESPSRRRLPSCYCPGPGRGGGVGSARCSLGTHLPCESSTYQRFKRRHVRRFGACAEADDTVVESWCVLSAPGV